MITLRTTCAVKGCDDTAEFYMRWIKRSGEMASGLVCDHHDRLYAHPKYNDDVPVT